MRRGCANDKAGASTGCAIGRDATRPDVKCHQVLPDRQRPLIGLTRCADDVGNGRSGHRERAKGGAMGVAGKLRLGFVNTVPAWLGVVWIDRIFAKVGSLSSSGLMANTSWIKRSAPVPYLMTLSLRFVSPERTADRPSFWSPGSIKVLMRNPSGLGPGTPLPSSVTRNVPSAAQVGPAKPTRVTSIHTFGHPK